MELGTVEARGRDGDDSRTTSRKYNDHRHSALDVGANDDSMSAFILEKRPAQNDMGLEELTGVEVSIRAPGDLVKYRGLVWMFTSENEAVPLGIGPCTGFSVDAETGVGSFRYESMRAQELITMRAVVSTPTFEDAATGRVVKGESIGGVLLDMTAHSMSRARPMVRLSVTAGIIPDATFNALRDGAVNPLTQGYETVNQHFLDFLATRAYFLCQLRLVWDRSGEEGINSVGIPEFGVPVFGGDGELTLEPVEVRRLSADGLASSISVPLALDTTRSYVFRLYAGVYSFSAEELEQQWQIYITDSEVIGIDPGATLQTYFGPLVGLEGATVGDQISYLLSLCSLEVLNSKLIIDNYCGLRGAVNESGRYTLSELPS